MTKFKEIRALYGGACSFCYTQEDLQFAHVHKTDLNGRGRGRKERYYDILNNPECYRLLCRDCHQWYEAMQEEEEGLIYDQYHWRAPLIES